MLKFQKNVDIKESKDFEQLAFADELFFSADESDNNSNTQEETNTLENFGTNHNLVLSVILALNTCYHVKLHNEETRQKYRQDIAAVFNNNLITEEVISEQINLCYEAFLEEIQLPNAIARNQERLFFLKKLLFQKITYLIIY